MAGTCSICGSPLLHYENPSREVCPTPDRHNVSRKLGRASGTAKKPKPGKGRGSRGGGKK